MTHLHPNAVGSAQDNWTILGLLAWAEEYLVERSFDDARLNAELLLAHVLGLRRLNLYLQFDRPLTAGELASFKALFLRRVAHEPLQYILGDVEFMGLTLEVNPSVLIPRPETEELVERALDWLTSTAKKDPAILDIGTGSGNIALALAKFLPVAIITALDVSPAAIEVAKRNAQRHGALNVDFIVADAFTEDFAGRSFDLVVSNPPYVSASEFAQLQAEVREFEPRIATTDDSDGLRFIRQVAAVSRRVLNPGGALFMEIAYNQARDAQAIVEQAGLTEVSVRQDFSGHPRIVSATAPRGPR